MSGPLLKNSVSIYKENFTAEHQQRGMKELEKPEVLEKETGILAAVWRKVQDFTESNEQGVHYTDLTDDTVLLVINTPGKVLSGYEREKWWPDYDAFRDRLNGKKLFVHVEDGILGDCILNDLRVSVLDVGPGVLQQDTGWSDPIHYCTIETAIFRGINLRAHKTAMKTVLTTGQHPNKVNSVTKTYYGFCQFPADVEIRNLLTGKMEEMKENYELYKCECANPAVFRDKYRYQGIDDNDNYNVQQLQTPLNFNSSNF